MKHSLKMTMAEGMFSFLLTTAALMSAGNMQATPLAGMPETTSTAPQRKTVVTAGGATLPLPFYNEAFKAYWEKYDSPVTYAGIGTGRGIEALRNLDTDFAGVDVPLTDKEQKSMPAETVMIPTCAGAVTIAYNLPGVSSLKMTGELLADIYSGKIVKWNDARITAVNPGTQLPDLPITPVYRSDESGTTYIFSSYLANVSQAWKSAYGYGKSVKFPAGAAAAGNTGVAKLLGRTAGAVGYIGSEYSLAYDVHTAALKNAAGNYVLPSPGSVAAAAKTLVHGQFLIENTKVADAYPLSCFSWIILYKEQNYGGRSRNEAEKTVSVLKWLVSPEAQNLATGVQFAPLSTEAAAYALKVLDSVTYDGKPMQARK